MNIQLTPEELELIQQALSIAEKQYSDTHALICKSLIQLRFNDETKPQRTHADFYHVRSCKFADLNIKIESTNY